MSQATGVSNPKYTIPEPRSAVVRRQRLLDMLHESIDQPLQLICAPAGYGKTTLLTDFARDTDLPVCWYAADELDCDPHAFLINLFEAIKTRFPFLNDAEELLYIQAGVSVDWRSTVINLANVIRKRVREFFVLIIDDLHILTSSSAVIEAVDLFVQRVPDNCRIIISTRELPRMASLPRLISQRRIAGLGPSELKFNADEIRALLKKNFDLEITPDEAQRLEQESEGWITSILLTTYSLWKGLFRDVLITHGRHSLLFEYMASEVFSQQPPGIQSFLLATSVCNEFDADLSRTLTGADSPAEVLKEIESRNLFITRLEGPHTWYRYHNIFRDFLRDKLKREDPNAFMQLHAAAAQHYLSREEPRQAIQHYIQGAQYEKALDILEAQAESLAQEGLWDSLGQWLEQIPAELRAARPELLLYLANTYQLSGRTTEALKLLTDIIEVFRERGMRLLEARAYMRRSVSLRSKGAVQMAIRDARAALALAQEHSSARDEADARNHLGRAFAQQGKFNRAEKEFRYALERYQQEGDLYQLSQIHKNLGAVYTALGESTKASGHYEMARQGWRKLGNQSELAVTLNNMAVLYYEEGRYEDAESLANEALSLVRSTNSRQRESYALMTLADIHREQEQYDVALGFYQAALELARECMNAPMIAYGSIGLGETYRLTGDSRRAKSLLKEAMTSARELEQDFELGIACTSLGAIEYDDQHYDQSIALLQKACQLLERAKQRRHLARARFHLAHALFLARRFADALEQLEAVAKLCEDLGYDCFLLSDVRRAPLMVQYAAITRWQRRDFFAHIGEQANQQSIASQGATEKAPATPQPTISAPRLEVYSFGSQRFTLDRTPILTSSWGSAKAREMFFFMLFHRQPLHKEKIVEALWPEITSSKVNSNFHSTLHRMKAALYQSCVEFDGQTYRLNPQWDYWFDAHEFLRLLREAEQHPKDSPERENALRSAIELYKGPFLNDIDSEWCATQRTDMELKFWTAVEGLADGYEAKGELQQSIAVLEQALEVDELQEEVYYRIMDLYLQLGDNTSATRMYKRCMSVFGETVPFGQTKPLRSSPKVTKLLSHIN